MSIYFVHINKFDMYDLQMHGKKKKITARLAQFEAIINVGINL